jgi:hypothetical protein
MQVASCKPARLEAEAVAELPWRLSCGITTGAIALTLRTTSALGSGLSEIPLGAFMASKSWHSTA